MNQEIKRQWVEDLRSEQYKQGSSNMRCVTDNTYCCLGVLAEQAVRAGAVKDVNVVILADVAVAEYDGASDYLPKSVMEWAGLDSDDPQVVMENFPEEGAISLAQLNDSGYTFDEIAGIIERQL